MIQPLIIQEFTLTNSSFYLLNGCTYMISFITCLCIKHKQVNIKLSYILLWLSAILLSVHMLYLSRILAAISLALNLGISLHKSKEMKDVLVLTYIQFMAMSLSYFTSDYLSYSNGCIFMLISCMILLCSKGSCSELLAYSSSKSYNIMICLVSIGYFFFEHELVVTSHVGDIKMCALVLSICLFLFRRNKNIGFILCIIAYSLKLPVLFYLGTLIYLPKLQYECKNPFLYQALRFLGMSISCFMLYFDVNIGLNIVIFCYFLAFIFSLITKHDMID